LREKRKGLIMFERGVRVREVERMIMFERGDRGRKKERAEELSENV